MRKSPVMCLSALLLLLFAAVSNGIARSAWTTESSKGPLTVVLVETDGQEWSLDIQRDSVWQRFVFPLSAFGSGGDFLDTPVAILRLVPVGGGTIGGPVFEVADWIDGIILGDTLIDDFEDGDYSDWHPTIALNGSYLDVNADPSTPDGSLRCLRLRHGNSLSGTFAGWMDKQLNGLSLSPDDTLLLWLRGYGYMVSDAGEFPSDIPGVFALHQNFPNPFNPLTIVKYQLPTSCYVTLKIYDLLGREVATLVDEVQDAGYKSVEWSPMAGSPSRQVQAAGVYFYRLQAGKFVFTKKLVLMK